MCPALFQRNLRCQCQIPVGLEVGVELGAVALGVLCVELGELEPLGVLEHEHEYKEKKGRDMAVERAAWGKCEVAAMRADMALMARLRKGKGT